MTAPAKRRWFQFRLRTLFVVVTLFGIWLGWNLNFVRQRSQMQQRIDAYREDASPVGFMTLAEANRTKFWGPEEVKTSSLPLALRMLGAEPVSLIVAPEGHFSDREIRELERLFPEALVVPWALEKWNDAMAK